MDIKKLVLSIAVWMLLFSPIVLAIDMNVSITVVTAPPPSLPVAGMTIGAFTSGFFGFLMLLGFILMGVKLFLTDIPSGSDLLNRAFIFVIIGLVLAGAIGIILTI